MHIDDILPQLTAFELTNDKYLHHPMLSRYVSIR